MKLCLLPSFLVPLFIGLEKTSAFHSSSYPAASTSSCSTKFVSKSALNVLHEKKKKKNKNNKNNKNDEISRSDILKKSIPMIAALLGLGTTANAEVMRAVGGAEIQCRKEGNCLERGELDGALGWEWGSKDRCDPNDPSCGVNGKVLDADSLVDLSPPQIPAGADITDIIEIQVSIGKKESGVLKLGLFGNAFPEAVSQFKNFVDSKEGLFTNSLVRESADYYVTSQAPVNLCSNGFGSVNTIYPSERISFGLTSQGLGYAKEKSLNKIPTDFVPQQRPKELDPSKKEIIELHDTAGLLSIPKRGLGYTGYSPLSKISDDEIFTNAFSITTTTTKENNNNNKNLDKDNLVIGQILDSASMSTLNRISNIPTIKGFKGVIPGQDYGAPFLKVQVTSVSVNPVTANENN